MNSQIILTDEQQIAVDMATKAINEHKPIFRIGGYAGTGKTTIAKYIVENIEGAMVCAFTGKAAHRLRQKGLGIAQTIHSLIYDYDRVSKKFIKVDDVCGEYFLIDEGSMISEELWKDILSFNKPILLLGDPGQLQPIGKDPRLMHEPDVVLEKIHRQAAESQIIQFATDIRINRHGSWSISPYPQTSEVRVFNNCNPKNDIVLNSDIVICGRNSTRHKINKHIRQLKGYTGLINPGEQVIILKNNNALGVFNGQILTIQEIINQSQFTFRALCSDNGDEPRGLTFTTLAFGKNPPSDFYMQELVIADYGYCITCHKAQGSEWDIVTVIDQQCPYWEPVRWRYTAITRAAKKLNYFYP